MLEEIRKSAISEILEIADFSYYIPINGIFYGDDNLRHPTYLPVLFHILILFLA